MSEPVDTTSSNSRAKLYVRGGGPLNQNMAAEKRKGRSSAQAHSGKYSNHTDDVVDMAGTRVFIHVPTYSALEMRD